MGFKQKFYKNIAKVSSYTFLTTGISFASSTITARLLTPAEFGTLALITVFSGFVAFFKDSGISYLVIRENFNKKELGELHSFSVLMGAILFILMLLLSYPISLFYNNHALIYPTVGVSLMLFLESLTIVPFAILSKELKFDFIGRGRLIALIISILVTILLALLGFSYWSLIIGSWFSAISQFHIFKKFTSIYFGKLSISRIKIIFTNSKQMLYQIAGSRVVSYWSSNSDNLLIGKFYGLTDIGIYNRAYQLLTLQLNLISGTFFSVLLPSLKELENDFKALRHEYLEVLKVMNLLIIPIMAVLVLFSSFIIQFLWGSQWLAVADIVPYFGIMAITYLLISTIGSIYVISRKEKFLMPLGIITSIVLIGIMFYSIRFSIETFVFCFTSGYILIVVPISLYFATQKASIFTYRDLYRFWLPKIVFSFLLLLSVYMHWNDLKFISLMVYFLFSCFESKFLIINGLRKLNYQYSVIITNTKN